MSGTPKLTLDAFLETAKTHNLWGQEAALLVGISGGPDSVACAHLAFQSGRLTGLAHVNYHLRGAASDLDEQLVRELAEQWQVPVFVHHTSPEELQNHKEHSLQMAARVVRYAWWADLISSGKGTCLLTGHQADDQIETILLHWMRGTGLAGWAGIPFQRDNYCRPLLPFTRAEILDYLDTHQLPFRLDTSNDTDAYLRNRIRHQILPALLSEQPALHTLVHQQSQDASMALSAANAAVEQLAGRAVQVKGQSWTIDLKALESIPWSSYAFHRWLHPKGFNRDQILAIDKLTSRDHGSYFQAEHWECVVNRGQLICQPLSIKAASVSQVVQVDDQVIQRTDGRLVHSTLKEYTPSDREDQFTIIVDANLLTYPLVLRHWQAGDRIHPRGMHGSKKIKDILIDAKVDRFNKARTLVLCQGDTQKVIWLIGYRSSRQVEPTSDTTSYLKLTWQPKSDES